MCAICILCLFSSSVEVLCTTKSNNLQSMVPQWCYFKNYFVIWKKIFQVSLTGSIFYKLMLIGINSILQLLTNWALYQMLSYFTKDRCQPDKPVITWVVPFTIFKYYHNIRFLLVSIKCLYFCICVSIYLSQYLASITMIWHSSR